MLVMDNQTGSEAIIALAPTLDDAHALFKKEDIDLGARTEFRTASGDPCLLVSGTQRTGELVVDKWIAMCGGPAPAMVTFQALQRARYPPEWAEAALRSIHVMTPPGQAGQLAALPFTVTPVAPFRVWTVLSGSGVSLPGGPLDVDPTLSQPFLIVASQVAGAPLDPATDPGLVSRQHLAKTEKLINAVVSRQ